MCDKMKPKLLTTEQRTDFEQGLCPICNVPFEHVYAISEEILKGDLFAFKRETMQTLPCDHTFLLVDIIGRTGYLAINGAILF